MQLKTAVNGLFRRRTVIWPMLFCTLCEWFTFPTPTDLFATAWQMARTYRRPTTYDASYLALASIERCELWTADRRLVNSLGGRLPWVKLVGKA